MAEKKFGLKNYNFVAIQGWMRNILKLSGNELIVYTIIFGFSQGPNQWCSVSPEYFSDWTGASIKTVNRILLRLSEEGRIKKRYSTNEIGRYCEYKAIIPEDIGTECLKPFGQSVRPNGQTDQNLLDNLSSDTIKNNIYNNINNNIGDKSPAPASKTRFVKPTVDEIAAYCRERNNNVDAQYFFDYYEGNGWKRGKTPLKDWKATVRTWERNSYSNSGRSTCGNNNPAGFDEMFD